MEGGKMKWYNKLWRWGLMGGNYYGTFHAFAGLAIAKVANIWLAGWLSVLIVLVGAIIWERIEFKIECKGDWKIVERTYGTVEKYWYDTVGDILLALIFAAIVVL